MESYPYLICYFSIVFATKYADENLAAVPSSYDFQDGHLKFHVGKENLQRCHANKGYCQKSGIECWGYEKDCSVERRFSNPICHTLSPGQRSLESQAHVFWEQADFGYIKKKIDGLNYLCKSEREDGSSFMCNKEWQYCAAENLVLDFRKKQLFNVARFGKDFFQNGEIGGDCKVNSALMEQRVDFPGELNGWNDELKKYTNLKRNSFSDGSCDMIVEKPTIFMKLDAGGNMFHHFCDFFNLYASQHMNGSFSKDVYIVHWDPSARRYGDLFSEVWDAFSNYPLKYFSEYSGKKVCFRNAMFSLLPRMIFGLFYNTPVVSGCEGARLFKVFSEHVLHRLSVTQDEYQHDEIRITLLMRSTKHRKILNQDELIGAMRRKKGLNVTAIDFNYREIKFVDQLKRSHNSDIFIGMHGAGLTHLMFQPDWGVVFEIYNTDDADCYKGLANFRDTKYLTWENKELLYPEDEGIHPQLKKPHAKFTNYAFDVDEFMRILTKGIHHVLKNRP